MTAGTLILILIVLVVLYAATVWWIAQSELNSATGTLGNDIANAVSA